jgi:Glycosyl hydrolase family 76
MRLVLLAAISAATLLDHAHVGAEPPPFEASAEAPLARASETRAFTERHLQHLAGGPDCPRAVFVSYAVSDVARDRSEQWYDVSQIWSDLALASPGDPLARCWASRGFTFLDRLWDRGSPAGGFFARSDLDGEQVSRPDKYADDNSLAGLAWMEAAQRAPDALERELMLGRARATANFLINGGIWDETFGGGFWWNTRRGDTIEGKPAETNGLAAAFFLQLYGLTGEPEHREWALRTLAWLDNKLFDPAGQLYRWSVHFQDLKQRQGELIEDRFFNYDQGILIEANLLAYRYLGDPGYLERARLLARRIEPVFWDNERGGYNLEAGIAQVYTVYSAWMSQSLLMLYEQDRDPHWLNRATTNLDALNRSLWDSSSGGYNQRHYVCIDRGPPGCGGGAVWAVDAEKHTVAQAWMQRAQALLASSLLAQQ